MITKIKVYGRHHMESLVDGNNAKFSFVNQRWHLVSIHGSSKEFLTPRNIANLKSIGLANYISLCFWDITDNPEVLAGLKKSHPDHVVFTQHLSQQIVDFLKNINQNDNGVLVCHCDAGISRSGAVATFACELFGLDYKEFLNNNPWIMPNRTVLRVLRNTAGIGGASAFMTNFEAQMEANRKDVEISLKKYDYLFT